MGHLKTRGCVANERVNYLCFGCDSLCDPRKIRMPLCDPHFCIFQGEFFCNLPEIAKRSTVETLAICIPGRVRYFSPSGVRNPFLTQKPVFLHPRKSPNFHGFPRNFRIPRAISRVTHRTGRALFEELAPAMRFFVASPVTPFQKTIVLFFYAAILRPAGPLFATETRGTCESAGACELPLESGLH
jgi:hypothetical protein